jgi:hypothetical protein
MVCFKVVWCTYTSDVISAFTTASEPRQNMGIGGLAGGTFVWALVISFTVL